MRKFLQNKLWRDNIPDKMRDMGSVIHIKQLTEDAYKACLMDKLVEEVAEVTAATTQAEVIEEIADVLEVLDAIYKAHGVEKSTIEETKQKKFQERGGFFERQFVTIAEHEPGSFGEKYCLAEPEKYPEVA